MISIKTFVKAHLPDGPAKTFLRNLYFFAKNFKYLEFYNNSLVLAINNENFNHTVRFPFSYSFPIDSLEFEISSYFQKPELIDNADIVIDAGAYPLDFTMAVMQTNQTAKVYALEPELKNIDYSRRVKALNQLNEDFLVSEYALAGYSGETVIASNGVSSKIHQTKGNTVKCITLDDFLAEIDAKAGQKIIVKMDIEGAELEVIRAAKRAFELGVIFMIASYHDDGTGRPTEIELNTIFDQHNYKVSTPGHIHKITYAWPK